MYMYQRRIMVRYVKFLVPELDAGVEDKDAECPGSESSNGDPGCTFEGNLQSVSRIF